MTGSGASATPTSIRAPVLGAAGLTHVHRQTPRPVPAGRSGRWLLRRSAVAGEPPPRDGLMPPGPWRLLFFSSGDAH